MTSQKRLRLVVDTDIGVDDAIALVLALRAPSVAVSAITTVAGNTDVEQCIRNARYVVELCDAEVPVYRGADSPIAKHEHRRPPVHGEDGLGDLGLRPINALPQTGVASDRLIELASANRGELTLLTLGPLTNLALALRHAPDVKRACRRLVVMGGAVTPGVAEFNFWSDPVAASEVLASGLPITLVPIEVSQGAAALTTADVAALKQIDTKHADFVHAMCGAAMRRAASNGAGVPDAIAMAIAVHPDLVARSHYCRIEIDSIGVLRTNAATSGPADVEIVDEIDVGRYKSTVRAACS